MKVRGLGARETLLAVLADYQNPVPLDVMRFQIALAVEESSDRDFVPASFRTPEPAAGK